MAVTTTELKRLQEQIKKLRLENARLKKRLGRNGRRKPRSPRALPRSRRVVKLGGLWAGTSEITEQDIAQARAKAWKTLGAHES